MDQQDFHYPCLLSSETIAKGMGLAESVGKEDPVELDSSSTLWNDLRSLGYVGAGNNESEIPLLLMLFYLFRESEARHCPSFRTQGLLRSIDLGGRHCHVGSLAGVVPLLKDNASILRWAQREQKSRVEQKDKSSFDSDFQYECELWKRGLSIL